MLIYCFLFYYLYYLLVNKVVIFQTLWIWYLVVIHCSITCMKNLLMAWCVLLSLLYRASWGSFVFVGFTDTWTAVASTWTTLLVLLVSFFFFLHNYLLGNLSPRTITGMCYVFTDRNVHSIFLSHVKCQVIPFKQHFYLSSAWVIIIMRVIIIIIIQ